MGCYLNSSARVPGGGAQLSPSCGRVLSPLNTHTEHRRGAQATVFKVTTGDVKPYHGGEEGRVTVKETLQNNKRMEHGKKNKERTRWRRQDTVGPSGRGKHNPNFEDLVWLCTSKMADLDLNALQWQEYRVCHIIKQRYQIGREPTSIIRRDPTKYDVIWSSALLQSRINEENMSVAS